VGLSNKEENSLKRAKAIMRDIDATSTGESRNAYEETLCSKQGRRRGSGNYFKTEEHLIPQALFSQKKGGVGLCPISATGKCI